MATLSTDFLRRRAHIVREYRTHASKIREVRLVRMFHRGQWVSNSISELVAKLNDDYAYLKQDDPVIYVHLRVESRCLDNAILLSRRLDYWSIHLNSARHRAGHKDWQNVNLPDKSQCLRFVRKTSSRLAFWEEQLRLMQKQIDHARAGF